MFTNNACSIPTHKRLHPSCLKLAIAVSLACLCTSLLATPAVAADTVWTSNTGGDWFDAQNWNGLIPNAPGDVAHLKGSAFNGITVDLTSPVTLGKLEFSRLPPYELTGSGPLVFDNPGPEAALLSIYDPIPRPVHHVLGVPLGIADGEQLILDVPSAGALPSSVTLSLDGGITVGNGDLVKRGGGQLAFNGASPNWDGQFTIDDGAVLLRDAASLGTAAGATRVNTGGTLRLINDVTVDNEVFQLDGGTLEGWGTSFGGRYPTLNNQIETLSSGRFENVNTGGHITLNGSTVGPGDIHYGRGRFFVFGANSYEGVTTIGHGQVDIRHEHGLGSPLQGTVVNEFGKLVLQQTVPEPITLRGGEVLLASEATSTGIITLESGILKLPRDAVFTSPLVLANTGGDPIVQGDRTTLSSGTTGVGNLLLRGTLTIDQQPLAHDGGLNANGGNSNDTITLNVANSYTGSTVVRSGRLVVNHEDALGSSVAPVEVQPNGRLVLNVPTTKALEISGILEVNDPLVVLEQTIELRPNFAASPAPGGITGQGTFNGEIHIAEDTFAYPFLTGGTFNGTISGLAKRMRLGGGNPVILNANSTYQGLSEVGGSEPVEVNSPTSLGSTEQGTLVSYGQLEVNAITDEPLVVINRGRVNLNVQQPRLPRLFSSDTHQTGGLQTVAINTPSQYDEWVDVVEGQLEINADTTLRGVTIRKDGQLRVTGNNTLQLLSEELTIQSGSIEGRIRGVQTLRKTTNNGAEWSHLPGFEGEIVFEGGRTTIQTDEALGTSAGATRVVGERNTVLHTLGPMTINDDLFLDNATGVDNQGGLFIGGSTVTLNGRLDLGEDGSIVGGSGLNVFGPVTGGDLITSGEGLRMGLRNANNTYTGKTDIRSGRIELAGSGRLQSTSKIVLHEASETFNGTLHLNNADLVVEDRVSDTIPIEFRGGSLDSLGILNETLGHVTFVEGESAIDLEAGSTQGAVEKQLRLTSLTRLPGATARLDVYAIGQVHVNETPQMVGGILPWMLVTDRNSRGDRWNGFGTITERGIVPITDYQTDINQASASDNVFINANVTLANDRVTNSLTWGNTDTLDLGSNQLVMDSGGLFFPRITNGQLTAGAGGQYELVVHHGRVEADIVDNGEHSVSVTTTGGTTFSGNNTYTGATYVNENTLYLQTETALPDGTDLHIVGGEVRIGYNATAPKHLGQVRISGDGALTQQFTGQRGQGLFSFDQIVLEEGELWPGQLVGSGDIVKETLGSSSITADLRSTYSGDLVVNEGRLHVRGLSEANFIVNSGKLVLPTGGNDITLAGGELEFLHLTGTIEVTAPSRIVAQPRGSSRNHGLHGTLVGTGDIAFDSNPSYPGSTSSASDMIILVPGESPDFSGNVDIYSTMVTVRKELSLGTGEITIHPGGRLRLSPQQGNFEGSRLDFPNDVHLLEGEIRGFDSVFRPQQLLGNLLVSGHSSIRNMNVLGTTHLADGSRLTAYGEGVLQFLGDINIGGHAELEYGLTRIVTNAADIDVGTIQLLGTISSDAETSVLNLIDRGLDELVLNTSFHVASGQTLQILKDGQPMELVLDGANNQITGGGTMLNPVVLGDGATISPGNSPGTLFFGSSTTLGSGTIYEWEIAASSGLPGTDWDFLQVAGDLLFEATTDNPWVLEVIGLQGFHPGLSEPWLIASANSIQGFDPATVHVDISGITDAYPSFSADQFVVFADGGNLLLQVVPEPASWLMALIFAVFMVARRRVEIIID